MISTPKSATTAGVLAIFFGAFGAHDWYLDKVKPAKAHIALFATGIGLICIKIILRAIIPSITEYSVSTILVNISTITRVLGWVVIIADVIWGAIEGVLILAQGNAGLIAQGYIVAIPSPATPVVSTPVAPPPKPLVRASLVETQYEVDARKAYEQAMALAAQQNALQQQYDAQRLTVLSTMPNPNPSATPVSTPPSSAPATSVSPPVSPALPTVSVNASPTVATPSTTPPQTSATQPSQPSTSQPSQSLVTTPQPASPPQPLAFNSSDLSKSAPTNPFQQPVPAQPLNSLSPAPSLQTKTVLKPAIKRVLTIAAVIGVITMISLVVLSGFNSAIGSGYGESYRLAKELSPKITNAHQSSSCEYVVNYVNSALVDQKTYDSYVNTCQELASNTRELVAKLGASFGVSNNNEAKAQFANFQQLYDEAYPAENDLSTALSLYQAWHNYLRTASELTLDSPDTKFQQVADILRESGNQTLANYGEAWLERELDYVHSYRVYQETSYTDENKEALRAEYEIKRTQVKDWVADHRPDITKLEPISVPDTTDMYNSFVRLYNLIKNNYEQHYDKSSGDCNYNGDKAYCT